MLARKVKRIEASRTRQKATDRRKCTLAYTTKGSCFLTRLCAAYMRFKIRNDANRSLRRLYMIRGKMMSKLK